MDQKYDALDSWREEVGIKTTKGEIKKYSGDPEHDPTYDAIVAYIKREEEIKEHKMNEELSR